MPEIPTSIEQQKSSGEHIVGSCRANNAPVLPQKERRLYSAWSLLVNGLFVIALPLIFVYFQSIFEQRSEFIKNYKQNYRENSSFILADLKTNEDLFLFLENRMCPSSDASKANQNLDDQSARSTISQLRRNLNTLIILMNSMMYSEGDFGENIKDVAVSNTCAFKVFLKTLDEIESCMAETNYGRECIERKTIGLGQCHSTSELTSTAVNWQSVDTIRELKNQYLVSSMEKKNIGIALTCKINKDQIDFNKQVESLKISSVRYVPFLIVETHFSFLNEIDVAERNYILKFGEAIVLAFTNLW